MKKNKNGTCRSRGRRLLLILICVSIFAGGGIWVWSEYLGEYQAHISPDYRRELLRPVLSKGAVRSAVLKLEKEDAKAEVPATPVVGENGEAISPYVFTDAEYDFLYHQTGLCRKSIDLVLQRQDGPEELVDLQSVFFDEPNFICIRENLISHREQTTDSNGNVVRTTELIGLEDGDIIITKSSHVLGWRNGHAALVVDAKNRKTLEAIVIGQNSGIRRFKKWEKYPNVLVLRLAGVSAEERSEAARWARKHMLNVPYRLTAGFFGTKAEVMENHSGMKTEDTSITGTQCAHLIWRAYAQLGYDLDSNGGWIVTPKQLANSPLLEVVQVYGMDPDQPWP